MVRWRRRKKQENEKRRKEVEVEGNIAEGKRIEVWNITGGGLVVCDG